MEIMVFKYTHRKVHLESLYHGVHAFVVEIFNCRVNDADIPHLAKHKIVSYQTGNTEHKWANQNLGDKGCK
jgi:hypothetical protein